MLDVSSVRAQFEARYGIHPRLIVRAPGRVNLIGEHTDYNGGFVFPAAIDRATFVAARPRADRAVHVYAADLDAADSFSLDAVSRSTEKPWSNYVRGVVAGLLAADHKLAGVDLLIASDVPRGAGLSSSAALEVSTGYTFQLLNRLNILGEELALLAQGAEHTYVGVLCGIMDQFISALGREDHALLIDCRELTYRVVPLPTDAKIVIADSGVRHELAESGYNERRAQCEEAVRLLKPALPRITQLRDVTVADLQRHQGLLPDLTLRRARHVVTENRRVLDSVIALEEQDYVQFGELMRASHISMRDDYEITVPEIDLLADVAQQTAGCYGARMTGGGFGGSTVSLVQTTAVPAFMETVGAAFQAAYGRAPVFYVCRASDGVGRAMGES